MNKQIKVKKLVSLNPTKFKTINLATASTNYAIYLLNCIAEAPSEDDIEFKTFIGWLETEI
jgi:hypothetical protein